MDQEKQLDKKKRQTEHKYKEVIRMQNLIFKASLNHRLTFQAKVRIGVKNIFKNNFDFFSSYVKNLVYNN
jgi:hypothetical protein